MTSKEEMQDFQAVTRQHQANCNAEQVRHAVHFAFTMYSRGGTCDKEAVNKILKDLGMQFDNPLLAADAIFGCLDRNHDNTITCSEFEDALEPSISKYIEKGWTLDITDILKDAFSRPIREEKKEVELVDQAFLFAHSTMIRRHHGIGTFWGFRWLFKMYDDFYWKAADERGHCLHPSMRLEHLREHLRAVANGDQAWLLEALGIAEHRNEIPSAKARKGVQECAELWLAKLDELFAPPAPSEDKDQSKQANQDVHALEQHGVDLIG